MTGCPIGNLCSHRTSSSCNSILHIKSRLAAFFAESALVFQISLFSFKEYAEFVSDQTLSFGRFHRNLRQLDQFAPLYIEVRILCLRMTNIRYAVTAHTAQDAIEDKSPCVRSPLRNREDVVGSTSKRASCGKATILEVNLSMREEAVCSNCITQLKIPA